MFGLEHPRVLTVESLRDPELDPNMKAWAKALFEEKRYRDTPNMIHRTNLLTHSMAVKFESMYLGIILDNATDERGWFIDFDHFLLLDAAEHHDIAEIDPRVTDIPTPVKMAMTDKEKADLERREKAAVTDIARKYFGIENPWELWEYQQLHKSIREKQTPETQLVKVADAWDALGEKMHEVFCGNDDFIDMVDYSTDVVFPKIAEFGVWKYLKDHPALGFNSIPRGKELTRLPRLTKQDVNQVENLDEVFAGDKILQWPTVYQSWALTRYINFHTLTREFIFPGWYPTLAQRLHLE